MGLEGVLYIDLCAERAREGSVSEAATDFESCGQFSKVSKSLLRGQISQVSCILVGFLPKW